MGTNSSIPSINPVATLLDLLPKALAVLPSLALVYAATWYFADRLGGGGEMIRSQRDESAQESGTDISARPDGPQFVTLDRRQLVLALQILVGSLVTFGGTAYVIFAVNPLGTAFGSGHLLTGLAGLTVGIVTLRKKVLPRNALLGINIFTIAYSVVSDAAAGALSLLPNSAFHDSVIGTLIAIIMSSLIVYLVTRR
jgi:hypothetical protein